MTIAEKISTEVPAEKTADKRRALGRGLDSLLPGRPRVVSPPSPLVIPMDHEAREQDKIKAEVQPSRTAGDEVQDIPLDKIDANPYQTRKQFDEEALKELSESIREGGLLQPIVVRPTANGRFVLVLGERRCRASKIAGKTTIPAIVRTVSDQHAAEMTIVENLMRQDLTCLEQANAFARLSRDFGLTQEQIGLRTGMSRQAVANYMRVLKLPPSVQQHLADGKLGISEARVLLELQDPRRIELMADDAASRQYPVSFLQTLVDNANELHQRMLHPQAEPAARSMDPNVRAAQQELEKVLGLRVQIMDRRGKGRIVIKYSTLEDFDRVVEMLKGEAD